MNVFFSDEFMSHRVALEQLRRRMLDNEVTAEEIAPGFWYPGNPGYYTGEQYGTLNIHQHLTLYIGFIVRLSDALRRRRLDVKAIQFGIGSHLRWCDGLLLEVADAAARQARENNAPFPNWVSSVKLVHDQLIAKLDGTRAANNFHGGARRPDPKAPQERGSIVD